MVHYLANDIRTLTVNFYMEPSIILCFMLRFHKRNECDVTFTFFSIGFYGVAIYKTILKYLQIVFILFLLFLNHIHKLSYKFGASSLS